MAKARRGAGMWCLAAAGGAAGGIGSCRLRGATDGAAQKHGMSRGRRRKGGYSGAFARAPVVLPLLRPERREVLRVLDESENRLRLYADVDACCKHMGFAASA